MFLKLLFFFIFFSLTLIHSTQGQVTPEKNNGDSTNVYKEIQTYSKKRGKFTVFLHGLLFKSVDTVTTKKKIKGYRKKLQKPHRVFEGKIIRNIDIVTLDPFGYSTTDTSVKVQKILYKAGNKLHIKTQLITIRNLLLIRKNDLYDSLLIKESERLIRAQKYVQEVSFYITLPDKNSDSVDIFIRVMDIWSIKPGIAASPTRFKIELKESNLVGLGHNFENEYTWNHARGASTLITNYLIPNIRNTYINTSLHFNIDEYENYSKNINVERSFYSTVAKWAGGIYLDQQYRKDSVFQSDSSFAILKFKFNTQDYWAGYAKQIFKGKTEEQRSTDLIFTMRYLRIDYLNKPADIFDVQKLYSNEDFYLSGIGIAKRKYVQDKYIFNYGFIEDVPVGSVFSVTGGYQVKNNKGRLYSGLRLSYGDYTGWGYFSSNIEYGAFFRSSDLEQGVFSARINYFSELFEIGQWKFRQFVKPQLTIGINRFQLEKLTINEENGIRGFNSITLSGTKKLILTLQTQSYAPWNVIGFRFGPYLILSCGMLGDSQTGFSRSKLYSQFGFGVLIKNEFLVFSNFQISFSFYPVIPDDGNNIIKLNQDKTTDFGFQDFQMGKPGIVGFN